MASLIKSGLKNLDVMISTGVVGYTVATSPDPDQIKTAIGDNIANVVLGRAIDVAGEVADVGLQSGSTAMKEVAVSQLNTEKVAAGKLLQKMGVKLSSNLAEATASQSASALATTATADASLGPIGIALIIIQLAGAAIDMLWNPFQTYHNDELADMKTLMDNNISEYFKQIGYAFPTEVKPNVIPITDAEWTQFNKDREQYYTDNNLVTKSSVRAEESVLNILKQLKRFDDTFDKDPITGEYVPKSTSTVVQSKILDTSNSMSLLLLAGLKAKSLGLSKKKEITTPQLATTSTALKFVMANFIPVIIVFLILSCLMSSIIGVLFS